jgi:hypothetical protein
VSESGRRRRIVLTDDTLTRRRALACILSDGFQYIFAVMECADETSDKYELYYYENFPFIDEGVLALDKAKKLLAMMVCWVRNVLLAADDRLRCVQVVLKQQVIASTVKDHADSCTSGI